MTRRHLFAACFFAVLLALLYQIGVIFAPFLLPVLWAAILSHVTFPLHLRLTALLKGRETLSAALLTLGILALVVAPVAWLAAQLIQEAGSAYDTIQAWVQAGGAKQLPAQLSTLPFGGHLQEALGRIIVSPENLESFLLQSSNVVSSFVVEQMTGFATNAFLLAVNFLVALITLFFFFKDGSRFLDGLYRIIPLEDAHKGKIVARLDQTITAVVKGTVITAIVQGVLAGIAYAALGVPLPVFLMAVTIVLAPLPFGGTALIWGPVALYLLWTGPLWKAVVMLVWGAGVVTTVDNFLKPMLIGQGANLPVIFLFFSILGGLSAYGLIGLFLGPILLAILLTAIQIYREEYLHEQISPPPADTT